MQHDLISLNIQAARVRVFKIDGPALRIKRDNEATRWFPLRRIRQVCVTGNLSDGLHTLFELAEKRIPVTLFSNKGTLRCQLLHPHTETSSLPQLLEECNYDPVLQNVRAQWFINSQLFAYSHHGIQKGDVTLAKAQFIEALGKLLNKYKLKYKFDEVVDWMHGIAQANINQLLDKECIALHSLERSQLNNQMNEIASPYIKHQAFAWLLKHSKHEASPRNLHSSLGELERALNPLFLRCIHRLRIELEKASYSPTLSD